MYLKQVNETEFNVQDRLVKIFFDMIANHFAVVFVVVVVVVAAPVGLDDCPGVVDVQLHSLAV